MDAADAPREPDYRRIFNDAPDLMLVVDRHMRIVSISDSLLGATGRDRSQVIGRDLFEVYPDDPRRGAGQSSATMRRVLDRVIRERRPDSIASQRRDQVQPDGTIQERHWSTVLTPLLNADGSQFEYVLMRTSDITDYVRDEARSPGITAGVRSQIEAMEVDVLERSRELQATRDELERVAEEREQVLLELQQLLDLAPDAMVVTNAAGLIIRVNDRALQLFGYAHRRELVGHQIEVLVPDPLDEVHRAHRKRFIDAPYKREMGEDLDLFARRKDGGLIPVEISLSPFDAGQGLVVAASIRDVTDQRARALAAHERAERREQVAEYHVAEYQRALRAYRQVVRHRIANPLQVISGTAATLLDHPDVDVATRRTMFESILDAADKLQRATLFDPARASEIERELDPAARLHDDVARRPATPGRDGR